jgi:hypothetical protein
MSDPRGREAWALACIQVNDLLNPTYSNLQTRDDKITLVFTELVASWELLNVSPVARSLARLLFMLRSLPRQKGRYEDAAQRIEARFPEYVGLDFDTAFTLTAFAVYWWMGQAERLPQDPDAAVIRRSKWLENSSFTPEILAKYLTAVGTTIADIPARFDAMGKGALTREILPLRRRPFIELDEERVGMCPQLLAEKGGVDLFWLLTADPGGPKERVLWTDDYSLLFEGYVESVLTGLGERAGGTYAPSVEWSLGKQTGEIDGMLSDGRLLVVIEAKASLLSATAKGRASVEAMVAELDRKFVTGEGGKRKAVRQLVQGIQWLRSEREAGRSVAGIDLSQIEVILPVLCASDRALRFPGLGEWFDSRMRAMVGEASMPWRIGPLTICGLDDLDYLEQLALAGGPSLIEVLRVYATRFPRGSGPLWRLYDEFRVGGKHPRLGPVMDEWFEELKRRGVLRE